jgi:hypothetical protein
MGPVTSPDLRIYFVWQPVLGSDAFADAVEHAAAETDPRASHFWDDGVALGQAYATVYATGAAGDKWSSPLGDRPVAWDAAFLFPRGVAWGDVPPRPPYFMFPEPMLDMPAFDAKVFGEHVLAALAKP